MYQTGRSEGEGNIGGHGASLNGSDNSDEDSVMDVVYESSKTLLPGLQSAGHSQAAEIKDVDGQNINHHNNNNNKNSNHNKHVMRPASNAQSMNDIATKIEELKQELISSRQNTKNNKDHREFASQKRQMCLLVALLILGVIIIFLLCVIAYLLITRDNCVNNYNNYESNSNEAVATTGEDIDTDNDSDDTVFASTTTEAPTDQASDPPSPAPSESVNGTNCATAPASQVNCINICNFSYEGDDLSWNLIYAVGSSGNVTFGDLNDLIDSIDVGYDVKILSQSDGSSSRTSYIPDRLSIYNGNVYAQQTKTVSLSFSQGGGQYISSDAYYWFTVVGSDGTIDIQRYYIDGTYKSETQSTINLQFYVRS